MAENVSTQVYRMRRSFINLFSPKFNQKHFVAISTSLTLAFVLKFGWFLEQDFNLVLLLSVLLLVFILCTALSVLFWDKKFLIRRVYSFHLVDLLSAYLLPFSLLFLGLGGFFVALTALSFTDVVSALVGGLSLLYAVGVLFALAEASEGEDLIALGLFESKSVGTTTVLKTILVSAVALLSFHLLFGYPLSSETVFSAYLAFRI